ncbi:hypothetical protein BDZ45DRAFT_680897 [Acephala macrosclerotiorum]|nr:hypothetical protein BDZ45DRAFT_680897 [Acephala macrosclerotiorum]
MLLDIGCSDLLSQQNRPNYDLGTLWELSGRPKLPYRHIKKVLPPSLAGFGIEAQVRYYTKVTVHHPSRFRGDKRSEHILRLIPFDPTQNPQFF